MVWYINIFDLIIFEYVWVLIDFFLKVYATTAANPDESSYACYYDDDRQTYLGDLYSVNWMEDSDKGQIATETLYKQFEIVKKLTNESHVMEYGNLVILID